MLSKHRSMPPKSCDSRVDAMERDLEEMKLELQRIPSLERMLEHLSQNFVKLLQTMEEIQKSVQTIMIAKSKERTAIEGGETNSRPELSSPMGNSRNVADKPFGESREGRR